MDSDVQIWKKSLLLISLCVWLFLPFTLAQRPYILSSFPANGAIQLPCHTFIRTSLYFPFESKILDPATFSIETVHLYPLGQPDQWIAADLDYQPEWKFLTLRPREVLQPMTTYVFEITPGLVDGRGFAFLPFQLEFQTGDCQQDPEDTLLLLPPPEPIPEPEASLELASFRAQWQGDSLLLHWATARNWPPGELHLSHQSTQKANQTRQVVQVMDESWRRQRFEHCHVNPPWGDNVYHLDFINLEGEVIAIDSIRVYRPRLRLLNKQIASGGALVFEVWSERETAMAFILKNPQGKIIRRKAGMLASGRQQVEISLRQVPPGTYLAQFRTQHLPLIETIEILSP